jgi:hypothetical protein
LAIDKGDEDAPAFSIRASVISSARSFTRSTSSSTRSAIGVGGSRKKVKRKSVFGSRAFGDGGITLQLKALAGLRTASEWEIVESPSALVDMHAKFEHASEGTRPAVLGRADSILDCSPEEAFLWLVSGPTSLEQTRLGQDRGDPLSIVVSEKGPFEYVKAAIRKFPFRITNREYVSRAKRARRGAANLQLLFCGRGAVKRASWREPCCVLLFCGASKETKGLLLFVSQRERSEQERESAAAFLSSAAEAGRNEGRERSVQEDEGAAAIRLSWASERGLLLSVSHGLLGLGPPFARSHPPPPPSPLSPHTLSFAHAGMS